MIYVSRKEHFNAAHKLYNPAWTKEKNESVFGPCANENWHGHNFDLIVTVKGIPDPETGFVVDLKKLSTLIREEVVDKLDHKNLNLDVPFMGLMALVTNAWTIYQKIKFCKEDIFAFKPDVIILIDYGGFNRRIAKFGKENGLKVFYYIPPKVWAWYTSRAWELKANVDRMFVILPFEKAFYKKFYFDVDYVGNPVLDSVKAFQPDPDFLKKYEFTTGKTIVALLPGSRKMELKKIVPLMAAVVQANTQYQFAVAAIQSLPAELYTSLREIASVKFIFDG